MSAPICVPSSRALAYVMVRKHPSVHLSIAALVVMITVCVADTTIWSAETNQTNSYAADSLSLYTRLGEESGIARLVDTTMRRILADTALTPYLKSATPQSISYARKVAINHLCSESDGPCWSFFSSKMLAMVVELNDDLWKRLRGHVAAAIEANKLTGKTAEQTLEIVDQIGRDLLNPLKKK